MILTYKYRLLPTRQQHRALAEILESQRILYNAALSERSDAYQRSLLEVERGLRRKPRTITYIDQTNSLTICRQDPVIGEEFSRYPAFLQHWTLKRLDDAYKAFFRRVRAGGAPGFPGFRGRDRWHSFGFSQNGGFRFDGQRLRFKGLPGGMRLHRHRPLPGDIGTRGHRSAALRSIVLTRDPGGRKWSVSLACEVETPRRCQSRTAAVGINVGIIVPLQQSDGVAVQLPAALASRDKAARRAARALSRARRGSRRRAKTKRRLARIRAKKAAVRKHWADVQSARLTRCYATIAAEDLDIVRMTRAVAGTPDGPATGVRRNSALNREILNVGWGDLIAKIAYKAERDGAMLVLVDPAYTTQLCSGCGALVPKPPTQLIHRCGGCGLVIDRYENAAKNILARALAGPAPTGSAAGAADVGLPLGGAQNGAVERRAPGNTAGASRPDGGGRNPASLRARPPRAGEPQAEAAEPGGPRQPPDQQQQRDRRAPSVVPPPRPGGGRQVRAKRGDRA